MNIAKPRIFSHLEAVALNSIPEVSSEQMGDFMARSIAAKGSLIALFGVPCPNGALRLCCVMAHYNPNCLSVLSSVVSNSWPSFTPKVPQAHLFEREIAETWNVKPLGHPWLKPVRFPNLAVGQSDLWGRKNTDTLPAQTEFYRVGGEEIHEVAVGPVHAGIIEPGHFRFQCHGEDVFHLEISLGYQHRGVEKRLLNGPDKRSAHYMETLAGDSSIAHTLAYAQLCEALSNVNMPTHVLALRAVALELERLGNHVGDMGALAADVGYLPTMSYCGRLRGEFLNMTAVLCGSRFGRGLIRPASSFFKSDTATMAEVLYRIQSVEDDVTNAIELLWETPSVLARFKETGVVSETSAIDLGLVGPAARASGLKHDVRIDFPAGYYQTKSIPLALQQSGDVYARAWVRWLEIQYSIEFIRQTLKAFPQASALPKASELKPESLVVSLVEGWRGQVAHVAVTGMDRRFLSYKIVDPSFRNWPGLAMALRAQQISDFPLCNKSFNLSYCGHDL